MGRSNVSFEISSEVILIDYDVLFPEGRHPGVDLILPAPDLPSDRLGDIHTLALTHDRENHIGAVPYLFKQQADTSVCGSELTLALVAGKLKGHHVHDCRLTEMRRGRQYRVGDFKLKFFTVNHFIPDGLMVVLRTSTGTILHIGNFKTDQFLLGRRITDPHGFARFVDEGVNLFMLDPTNVEAPGLTPSGGDIEPFITRVFDQADRRLIVTCFASHMHHVRQMLNLAAKHGHKVTYVGCSMVCNVATTRDLGCPHVPVNILIEMKDIDKYRSDEVVTISTSSRDGPLVALNRIANREHPVTELGPGDIVLLASSLIPGNENSVYRVINGLMKLGAQVVHKGNASTHVSGHAPAGELLYRCNILKSRNVMPIHGETRRLIADVKLAVSTGVPAENTVVCEDDDMADLADGRARKVGRIDASYVFVGGSVIGDITELINGWLILDEEGFISVVVVVNLCARPVIGTLNINMRGFAEDPSAFNAVREQILADFQQTLDDGVDNVYCL